jgi:hypothetical protein
MALLTLRRGDALTNGNPNNKNNEQADDSGNGNQILFKRIKIVKMKINGEPISMT